MSVAEEQGTKIGGGSWVKFDVIGKEFRGWFLRKEPNTTSRFPNSEDIVFEDANGDIQKVGNSASLHTAFGKPGSGLNGAAIVGKPYRLVYQGKQKNAKTGQTFNNIEPYAISRIEGHELAPSKREPKGDDLPF